MNAILTQNIEVNSITKPINNDYERLESPLSDLFDVEEGTKLYTHTVTFPDIEILSSESNASLFKMDANSLTLCRLKRPNISQDKFCYTVKTQVTSLGYEVVKDIPWTALFYSHERGLNLDPVNRYFTNRASDFNRFHIQCNYKNKLLAALINLNSCDWYDIWLGYTITIWKFGSGTVIKCNEA